MGSGVMADVGLDSGLLPWLFTGVAANSFAYQASFGPLRQLYPAEVLPLMVRARGLALLDLFDYASGSVVVLAAGTIGSVTSITLTGSVMSATCFVGAASLCPLLCDTSSKSLEQVEQ